MRVEPVRRHGGGGDLVDKLCLGLPTSWIVAHQAPLSIEILVQEY